MIPMFSQLPRLPAQSPGSRTGWRFAMTPRRTPFSRSCRSCRNFPRMCCGCSGRMAPRCSPGRGKSRTRILHRPAARRMTPTFGQRRGIWMRAGAAANTLPITWTATGFKTPRRRARGRIRDSPTQRSGITIFLSASAHFSSTSASGRKSRPMTIPIKSPGRMCGLSRRF